MCKGIRIETFCFWIFSSFVRDTDNKVHGVSMGPTWVLSAPHGPHVGPMNLGRYNRLPSTARYSWIQLSVSIPHSLGDRAVNHLCALPMDYGWAALFGRHFCSDCLRDGIGSSEWLQTVVMGTVTLLTIMPKWKLLWRISAIKGMYNTAIFH